MAVISVILLYLSLPVALGLAIVALVSLAAFGGARRNALPLLATGVFATLIGGAYLYGVAASHFALQDNAYLGNIYLGLLLLAMGACALLTGGLFGAGLNRWAAVGLALIGLVGIGFVYRSIGLESTAGGQYVAVFALVALIVAVGALALLRRGALAGRALLLGVGGAVVMFGLYALIGLVSGGSLAVYSQFGVDEALAHKPPVLEGFGAALTLLLGSAVFLIARRWGAAPGVSSTGAPATA
ncbi:MAG: hypothetical protein KGO05_13550 [Chloroflexota bacterium]|nr:hypothetical protein [Chloroflexota bacterium]